MSKRTELLALTGILILSGVLRFTRLDWGLEHTPIRDEQDFVENVGEMIAHHDWDHRFYEYPGLFFAALRPVLAVAPASAPYHSEWDGFPKTTHFGRSGYLAARGLVAAAGVGSVLLVGLLGSALISAEGGLVAAFLMAVSPVEIFVAHEVRPDVVLEAAVLLALLSFRRLGGRLREDVVAGLAVGAAASLKLTGILIVPSYLVARALAPGRRAVGALAALATGAALWFATTPYALRKPGAFLAGVAYQVQWHYRGKGVFSRFGEAIGFYLMTFTWSLGPIAAALAVLGLVVALRRRLLAWAPALLYATALVFTLSTAYMHWHRLVLSGVGVVTLLAAAGFDAVRRRSSLLAWVLASFAALVPAYWSATYLRALVAPGARDRALEWLAGHLPPGSRALNSVSELGIDRSRFEVLAQSGSPALDRLLARQADAVIWRWPERDVVAGFDVLFRAKPRLAADALGQRPEFSLRSLAFPIVIFRAPPALRPAYAPIPLGHATVTASQSRGDAGLAVDGRLDTQWSTPKPQAHGDFFEIVLDRPALLGRVEILLGDRPQRYARSLRIFLTDDGLKWSPVAVANARPPVEEQLDVREGGASQLLVLEPARTRGVRLRLTRDDPHPWSIAELRLQSLGEP